MSVPSAVSHSACATAEAEPDDGLFDVLLIGGGVYLAFLIGGSAALYAVALAGCGLLTTAGVIVAMDTFGPVSDNAQGIAEMSGDIDEEGARVLTDLDAVGTITVSGSTMADNRAGGGRPGDQLGRPAPVADNIDLEPADGLGGGLGHVLDRHGGLGRAHAHAVATRRTSARNPVTPPAPPGIGCRAHHFGRGDFAAELGDPRVRRAGRHDRP